MNSETKHIDAPEPLPPSEHEKALQLEEARRVARERASDPNAAAELPVVHSDDL